MTLIVNTTFKPQKEKARQAKSPPGPSEEGLFSKLHLIQDLSQNSSYGYHLNPILPPQYQFTVGANKPNLPNQEIPDHYTLLGSGLEGLEEETRNELASCVTNGTYLGTEHEEGLNMAANVAVTVGVGERILLDLKWSLDRISAAWCMEVEVKEPVVDAEATPTSSSSPTTTGILTPTSSISSPIDVGRRIPSLSINVISTPPPIKRLCTFRWFQASHTNFKLLASSDTSESILVAEFVAETSSEKRARGWKGQLLFRDYFGREWEAVVLCSVGLMVDLRWGEEEVWI
ncbi:hypothetical protein GLAREA_01009 [Glarea lozoyensis ATCC 20868]|uniref:Uncharacterized protein n=1 Tax=Glarea lozoyensis (strain ATCC 20868 / MF5171) TaxID=1116229 RepID=S3CY33_GLAL2|nr:uncharacterized protein GLAREA_01009 [Glarea lozoyensis ATCC 20868]EPE29849.1 hypothetical protein GLAREA_01009 [Glarea lozoyensis ATCC 20868]